MKTLLHLLAIFFSSLAVAQTESGIYETYSTRSIEEDIQLEYNVGEDRVMLKGYSPVSYLEENKAEEGSADFQLKIGPVVYQFVNQDQLLKFQEDPDRYIPLYGGYCAYGVAMGKHLDIDPTNFKIIGGKTYLFLKNQEVDAKKLWDAKSEKKQLADAAAYWQILRLLPDEG